MLKQTQTKLKEKQDIQRGVTTDFGNGDTSSIFDFLFHGGLLSGIDHDLRGAESRSFNEGKGVVTAELASEVKEGLFEVVVGLGRDIIVLEVLLAMESDLLGLNLAILDINLVTTNDNGDLFADTDDITMPVGNVLVCLTGGNVEHNDGGLTLNATNIQRRKERKNEQTPSEKLGTVKERAMNAH